MKAYIITLTALMVILALVDGIYLYFSRPFYTSELENVQQSELQVKIAPLPIIYLLLTFAVLQFVIYPSGGGYLSVLLLGALLGVVIYGVYNLTNYSTLSRYSWRYVLRDTSWGATLLGLTAIAGKYIYTSVPTK